MYVSQSSILVYMYIGSLYKYIIYLSWEGVEELYQLHIGVRHSRVCILYHYMY